MIGVSDSTLVWAIARQPPPIPRPRRLLSLSERQPAPSLISLLPRTNLNSDQRRADVLLVPTHRAPTMTVPSSQGLPVRQKATRQQLKATLLLPHEAGGVSTA